MVGIFFKNFNNKHVSSLYTFAGVNADNDGRVISDVHN
jgi:hypothetical protein